MQILQLTQGLYDASGKQGQERGKAMSKISDMKARSVLRTMAGGLFVSPGGAAGFNALMKYVSAHESDGVTDAYAIELWAGYGSAKMIEQEDAAIAKEAKRKDISKKRSEAGKQGEQCAKAMGGIHCSPPAGAVNSAL